VIRVVACIDIWVDTRLCFFNSEKGDERTNETAK
jgi:hypothetical protein